MRPWSYSSLTLYEKCPYSYKLRYIDKIKSESSAAMDRGNAVHESMEDFLAGSDLPEEAEGLDIFCTSIRLTNPVVEEPWGFTTDWAPTGWDDPNTWCRMKLDVYVPSQESVHIIDWKTGKHYPVKAMDQGQLYAVGASVMSNVDVFDVTFAYLDQSMVKSKKYKRKAVDIFKKGFEARANKMNNDTTYIPKPHKYTCAYCGLKEACDYAC
jgi:hypothetical protein